MKKKDFKELTGENPEDILGNDWENEAEELNDGMDRLGLLKGIPHQERIYEITKNRKDRKGS